MPRRRKKKRNKDAPQVRSRGGEIDRRLASYWSRQIRNGLKAQEAYRETAEEVKEFLKNSHQTLFESPDTTEYVMRAQGSAVISVPRTAQMRNSLVPRLTYAKPHREVSPTTSDGVMVGLARVLERYLNYTAEECNLAKHTRRAVTDAVVRGRCFLRQVYNPTRGLIHSRYLSSLDVVFDPDFTTIEEAKWVAIRHREPFWETERRIQEKWRLKKLKHSEELEVDLEAPSSDEDGGLPQSADRLTYWVVYSKMGRGLRGTKFLQDGEKKPKDDQDFVRLEIVLDHEVPLAEGDWEVPLYLDEGWGFSYADLIDPLDESHPESIGGQVMPLQKGVDLLSTGRLNSAINRDRLVVLVDASVPSVEQHRIKGGSMAEILSVDVPTGSSLESVIRVVEMGAGSAEAAVEREFLLQEIEATTGVTQVLTGGEDTGAQDRSATASQLRNEAAGARVGDLKQRVDDLSTEAARNEAILVRLLLEVEDVEPFVRSEHIGLYYIRVEVPGGGVVPVRNLFEGEPDEEDLQPLTLADLSPSASNYFADPAEAAEIAARLVEDLEASVDPRVIELRNSILTKGIAEEDGLPVAIEIAPVDVTRVWEDTAGMTAEEVMREMSYSIAAGSSVPLNKESRQAHADKLAQTTLPVALQAGDVETANKILQISDDAFDVPRDQRVQLNPPAPAPEGGQQ